MRVRLVGVWAEGAKEPWWLATNLTVAVRTLAAWYDRRMTIEEAFRDTKGCRYGLQLKWDAFQRPAHLARCLQRAGLALALATALGAWLHRTGRVRDADLERYSLWRLGMTWLIRIPRTLCLTARWIRSHTPAPVIRTFDWISASEAPP